MTDKTYTIDEIKNIVAPIAKKYKVEKLIFLDHMLEVILIRKAILTLELIKDN